jgi:hypothetical protein
MYHSFFQHLLLRLPPRLADHVLGLLGQFATGAVWKETLLLLLLLLGNCTVAVEHVPVKYRLP